MEIAVHSTHDEIISSTFFDFFPGFFHRPKKSGDSPQSGFFWVDAGEYFFTVFLK
jgi:hypothetical protein